MHHVMPPTIFEIKTRSVSALETRSNKKEARDCEKLFEARQEGRGGRQHLVKCAQCLDSGTKVASSKEQSNCLIVLDILVFIFAYIKLQHAL